MRKDTPYKNNPEEDLPRTKAKIKIKPIEEILTVFALKKLRGLELIEPIKFPKKYKTDFVIKTLANMVVGLILRKTEGDTEAKTFEDIIFDEIRSMVTTKILPIINEENVFIKKGQYWVVNYKGKSAFLKDAFHSGEVFSRAALSMVSEKSAKITSTFGKCSISIRPIGPSPHPKSKIRTP